MILLIDNYDSFTFNLYQLLGQYDEVTVVRNDKLSVDLVNSLNPDYIVISPGPKGPKDAGYCIEIIQAFYDKLPILGVCLGHQCIGEAFGGHVMQAPDLMHGKSSVIDLEHDDIFKGIGSKTTVARYHSLIVEKDSLPEELMIISETQGEIMAVRHKDYPVYGFQFHPESILSQSGDQMIKNFMAMKRGA